MCRVHMSGTQRTFNKEIINLFFWRTYGFIAKSQNKETGTFSTKGKEWLAMTL